MRWKTHLEVAKWVGEELNIGSKDLIKMAKGSLAPDKWRDHSYHHNHKYLEYRIKKCIIKTRKLFLSPKKNGYFELGVLLHYIGDKMIPETSYPMHLNIEEEMTQTKKRKVVKNEEYQEIKKEIINLPIKEEEKNFLLNPTWVRGKKDTIALALIDLPLYLSPELLYRIVFRSSIGVASAVLSRDPCPLLLREKFDSTKDTLLKSLPLFKKYSILSLGLPFLYFIYGKIIGSIASFFIIALNLPILLIFRKRNIVKTYLFLRDYTKTIFIFFLLGSIGSISISVVFNFNFLLGGAFLLLLALLQAFFPKILVDEEIEREINWYGWK
jgi:hypothetical protein